MCTRTTTSKTIHGYTPRNYLGEGSFGKVYEVTKHGKSYALKVVYDKSQSSVEEINILQHVRHENIVKYIESFERSESFCIVMEFADMGTVKDLLMTASSFSKLFIKSEWTTIKLLKELSEALAYLHRKHIMHRDLKPENILCFSQAETNIPIFKLADFGIAKLLNSEVQGRYYAATVAGTAIYMAPEVLQGKKYTFSADIWSLGAILSFWWNERHLFHSTEEVFQWRGGRSTLPCSFQKKLLDVIADCLSPNRYERPSAEDISNMKIQSYVYSAVKQSNKCW